MMLVMMLLPFYSQRDLVIVLQISKALQLCLMGRRIAFCKNEAFMNEGRVSGDVALLCDA